MRKTVIILGLILSAIVMEGIVFYISSRMPATVEIPELEEPSSSTFDEMLANAALYKEQRRFGVAREFVRLALDRAKTPHERAVAGHQMGELLFEDYLRGGGSHPGAAVSYLQAAFDESDQEFVLQMEVGLELLDVLEEMGDEPHFLEYLESMIITAEEPEYLITLWRRKFEFLMNSNRGWRELTKALATAEAMPLQSAEWAELLADVKLRSREKLLADDSWLEAYALAEGGEGLTAYRMRVFHEIQTKLERIIDSGEKQEQEEALLRLANAMVSVENYEEAQKYLTNFLEREPTENLTEALMLLSRISRVQGEVAYAAELAESLIQRFDFNAHSQEEILQVVELLEEHELYEDALGLLQGCFSFGDPAGREFGKLMARAAVLEERLGDHDGAVNYMNQLQKSDENDAFAMAFSELINLNMSEGNYEAVENWILRFIGRLPESSRAYQDSLFSLFEAKYWLDRPVLEQLVVGSAAIQNIPEDPRVGSVELRMARYIEEMKLNDLAVSYYNRIGLLNFFQGNDGNAAFNENISEQAMLGKARCLKKQGDWAAADHLFRELCHRTTSPLVKSEAALGWAELAKRFGQNREAARRYDLAYVQMLSAPDQVRYTLGRLNLQGDEKFRDPAVMEDNLSLFLNLPDGERREALAAYFNETFDYLYEADDERAMLRLIDLAYQSDYAEWLPIQSYVLRLYEDRFQAGSLEGLSRALREKDEIADASLTELAQVIDKMERLAATVKKHQKKVLK
ncbi:tetratricopeptide repeat protein [Pontiellaceae bacterium B12219]|nr:tetratricopeptide repeat protein [Pontiellaceae bacterium B12219]